MQKSLISGTKKKLDIIIADEILPANKKLLDQIAVLATKFGEGITETIIPFLSIIRRSEPTPLSPGILTPSFCLIVQGGKRAHVGQHIIDFRTGNFAVSVIDMPLAGHIFDASKKSPYIGLRIDFTAKEIVSVITEAKITIEPESKKLNVGAFIGQADSNLLEILIKLIKLLDSPKDADFISTLLKREMIFRLLTGEYGHLFFQKALFDATANGIGKAIEWIKLNYSTNFTAEELASAHNMSVSGLHHKFKAITTMGPLQYQKQIRLQEARRLMLTGAMDVTTAALEVGYESPSQFNREYRRLFGLPPLKDINAIRQG